MADAGAIHFLSYSRSDERFALRFAKDLRAMGVGMWVDQLDIRPSEHWDRAVENAVRDCLGMVVILSPRSVASDNVADEISYAIDNRKPVLPVMIEKCSLPLRIARKQVIDASAGYERAVEQCASEIRRSAAAAADPAQSTSERVSTIDAQAVAAAKSRLAAIVGPIATVVVDKAAARASTLAELNTILAQHIDDPADRARFLAAAGTEPRAAGAGGPTASGDADALDAADLDRISRIATRYLGPIGPLLAKRESRLALSSEDLHRRLAGLIPSEQDRAAFLKAAKTP